MSNFADLSAQLLTQTNATLANYPRPFVVSPYRGALTAVWYLDYAHLLFWFFFLNLFVTFLILVFFFLAVGRYTELREVIRETRGFSRAQTGDLLTATMPLTWSATMIIHANTHSGNFDENTSMTSLALSVIAYQWGWNYFFPVDVAHNMHSHPVRVGRGGSAALAAVDVYASLLAEARGDYWSRVVARGKFAGRQGRGSVGHAVAIYAGAGLSANSLEGFPLYYGADSASLATVRAALAAAAGASSPVSGDTSAEASRLRSFVLSAPHDVAASSALRGFSPLFLPYTLRADAASNVSALSAAGVPGASSMSYVGMSTRARYTTFVVGNRLTRVCRFLGDARGFLPEHLSQFSRVYAARRLAVLGHSAETFSHSAPLLAEVDAAWVAPFSHPHVRTNPWLLSNLGFSGGLHPWSLPTLAGGALFEASPDAVGPLTGGAFWALRRVGYQGAPQGSTTFSAGDLLGSGSASLAEQSARLSAEVWARQRSVGGLVRGGIGPSLPTLPSVVSLPAVNFSSALLPTPTLPHPYGAAGDLSGNLQLFLCEPALDGLANLTALSAWVGAGDHAPASGILSSQPRLSLSLGAVGARPVTALMGGSAPATPGAAPVGPRGGLTPLAPFRSPCCAVWEVAQRAALAPVELAPLSVGASSSSPAHTPSPALVGLAPLSGHVNAAFPGAALVWLTGAHEEALARSSADLSADPARLNFKLGDLTSSPIFRDPLLYGWQWQWSSPLRSLPLDKFARAGIVSRPAPSYWDVTRLVDDADLIAPQSKARLQLDKNACDLAVVGPARLVIKPWYPEVTPAVLDSERAPLFPLTAVVLPAPYLDLDPAFMASRWTMGVNTTRRSNHAAKFKTSWGPALARVGAGTSELRGGAEPTAGHTPALLSALPASHLAQSPLVDAGSLLAQQSASYPHALFRVSAFSGVADCQSPARRLSTLKHAGGGLPRMVPAPQGAHLPASPWVVLGQRRWRGVATTGGGGASWPTYLETRLAFTNSLRSLHVGIGAQAEGGVAEVARGLATRQAHTRPRHGYAPMREDIGSMRRLRLTRGLCLPVATPIHGIFGSKDVIHSWAIPGLGLKVDCVPGYNSHRRVFLTWRGAYWGQCMEVCGRYHHWMPILVRVTHRDTFLSWCLSYVDGLRASDRAPVRSHTSSPVASAIFALGALAPHAQ